MSQEGKKMYKLTFGEWVILIGGVLSVGASHARIGYNSESIREQNKLISENKAFGIAREKKIVDTEVNAKEYARDYAYRKSVEIKKDVEKNDNAIHAIREEMVETRVKLSHIEKNQEKLIELIEKLIDNKNK